MSNTFFQYFEEWEKNQQHARVFSCDTLYRAFSNYTQSTCLCYGHHLSFFSPCKSLENFLQLFLGHLAEHFNGCYFYGFHIYKHLCLAPKCMLSRWLYHRLRLSSAALVEMLRSVANFYSVCIAAWARATTAFSLMAFLS